jgi:hypothetical protein
MNPEPEPDPDLVFRVDPGGPKKIQIIHTTEE